MNLPVVFTLNNPMLAPILVMISCFLLGGAVASGAFLAARKHYVGVRVQQYAKDALSDLDAQLWASEEENTRLRDQNVAMKVKIAQISLHLSKAIYHAEIDG